MTLEQRVDKLEKTIPEIMSGITEIKAILNERKEQDTFKDNNVEKQISDINKKLDTILLEIPKIADHERRITKIEDTQGWLWKTFLGSIITIVVTALIYVIKIMK